MADKHRLERDFFVGASMYLKLKPCLQTSVSISSAPNITAWIKLVAYDLDPPSTSKVHPVFHISKLKKHVGPHILPLLVFFELDAHGSIIVEPISILDIRITCLADGFPAKKWLGPLRSYLGSS
ncbi:hypothetical protein V2J09_012842 [Rumex salicifolius]